MLVLVCVVVRVSGVVLLCLVCCFVSGVVVFCCVLFGLVCFGLVMFVFVLLCWLWFGVCGVALCCCCCCCCCVMFCSVL